AICAAQCAPAEPYCRLRACEIDGRGRPRRDLCGGRWCYAHREFATPKPSQYVTPTGLSKYPEDWSDVLKAVARMNFLWEHVTPEDLTALLEVCRDVGCQPGAPLSVASLVTAFVAHTLKWPPAARHQKTLVALRPPTGPSEAMRLHGE
ncbi:unnamed protein product, partial [Prorocentrum cordatum]